ncbi:MAG: hypothetical protein OHK0013_11780 [Sandaracinaceae bacterium]
MVSERLPQAAPRLAAASEHLRAVASERLPQAAPRLAVASEHLRAALQAEVSVHLPRAALRRAAASEHLRAALQAEVSVHRQALVASEHRPRAELRWPRLAVVTRAAPRGPSTSGSAAAC